MAKAKKPAAKKHDWTAIRAEYVEAPSEAVRPTLEELAAKHGCSPSYLREKASPSGENWKLLADQYLASVGTKRQEVKSTELAGELAKWDENCFKAAKAMLGQVYNHIQVVSSSGKPIGIKELDSLTRSLERIHSLGRSALPPEPEFDPAKETAAAVSEYSKLSAAELAQLYQERAKLPPQK